MEKKVNLWAIIVALALVIIGGLATLLDITLFCSPANVIVNIGCSLIASGLVLLFTAILIDYTKEYSVWSEWRLERIFKTRAEKNTESDPKLERHNVKQLDGIAFGLKSFRTNRERDVLTCMQRGMNVRLLVMDPTSNFTRQREREEDAGDGSIAQSIIALIEWAEKLNKQSDKGKIKLRFYDCMTLDFYWRMDDEIYVGPYLLDFDSQQTITYKYIKGGKGFDLYSNYFESLWNNTKFCHD